MDLANSDSDVDLISSLQAQLHSLQKRVKELESEKAKLSLLLSNCHCQKGQENVNASAVAEELEELKIEGDLATYKGRTKKDSGPQTSGVRQFPRRYVALKVMYLGQRFYGFASEAHMDPTVESEIFRALKKTNLIDRVDKKELQYSRCGRTDKGVSSTGQVIALFLRSNLKQTRGNTEYAGDIWPEESCGEMDYVGIINKVLPKDIQVMGWSPAPVDFSARFSCLSRQYKYFFWRDNLNIMAMETAGKKFLGEHDFRNFCKMDAINVHNFRRCITLFEISRCSESFEDNELWAIKIKGSAFLWHQIRCMAALLFLIGEGLETPNVIDLLLDTEKTTRKPQYTMAAEIPLVLQSCEFEGLRFICSSGAKQALAEHLKKECLNYKLQAAIYDEALQSCSLIETDDSLLNTVRLKHRKAVYVPIMSRPTEPSYEERRAKFSTAGKT
ncbi:uncharacterized protein [Coffea arabica]|uniref:Pseudouridine synthase I TruA alpha/beta domain-containing protein n=1 Tax=Coffea arabica TaxID=13443 RepID=A0A6P6UM44_COFAR|nr:tRNA pseudouridine(38/39) synthase-like [Coffea arabica]